MTDRWQMTIVRVTGGGDLVEKLMREPELAKYLEEGWEPFDLDSGVGGLKVALRRLRPAEEATER